MRRTYIAVLFPLALLSQSSIAAGPSDDAPSGIAATAPYDDAWTVFTKGDCPSLLNKWRPLAEQGDAAAEAGLGVLYENGCAVPQDNAQALDWYRKAADQGNPEAEYRLGEIYVAGSHRREGLALMVRSGEHGNAKSFERIGDWYRSGLHGFQRDASGAVIWYRKAAELGDTLAEERLAIAYAYGQGVPKDLSQAASWYRKSEDHDKKLAEDGYAASQIALGHRYELGIGVVLGLGAIPLDSDAALFWYRKAAEQDGPLKETAASNVRRLESKMRAASSNNPK